jgi:DNA polymerase
VHDEIISEMPVGCGSAKEVERLMSEPISWAPGLPLAAKGFESPYYRKD